MDKIRVLDEVLANQIAAGEVVERPASAAKELLENALDASATAITVEIADGGLGRLRVVDNGSGMSAADARLALQRHATSKLRTAADLHCISTLGFRGEALPSIASVSRFRVRTREPDALGATLLAVEGGNITHEGEAAGPVGTEILVEDLFYNVPARRKFLKTANTESGHVLEALQRVALCYPGVAFRFVRDGKTTLDLPPHATLTERVHALFGAKAAEGLIPVHLDGSSSVRGLISPPADARATARHYHTFVNGRYVRDRVVISAVQSVYRRWIEGNRHPFVVLRIEVPPDSLDVNVHPAKTEVRFTDTSAIHRLLVRALEPALSAEPWRAPPAGERAYSLRPPPSDAPAVPGLAAPVPLGTPRPDRSEGASPTPPAPRAPELDNSDDAPGQPVRGGAAPPAPAAAAVGGASTAAIDDHRRRIFGVIERLAEERHGQRSARRPAAPVPVGRPPTASVTTESTLGLSPGSPPAREHAPGLEEPPSRTAEPASAEASPVERPPPAPEPARLIEPADRIGADLRALPDLSNTAPTAGAFRWAQLRPIARWGTEQLLVGGADGLLVVDLQAARWHVAHQRLARAPEGRSVSPPVVVALDARRVDLVREHAEALAAAGLVLEAFGPRALAVTHAPAALPSEPMTRAVALALDWASDPRAAASGPPTLAAAIRAAFTDGLVELDVLPALTLADVRDLEPDATGPRLWSRLDWTPVVGGAGEGDVG